MFQYLGWRWINWLVLICTGVSLALMFLVKETYAPALLRERTKKKQNQTDDQRWWCRYDHEETGVEMLKTNLIRPLRMIVFEPIWYFTPSASGEKSIHGLITLTVCSGTSMLE